LLVLVVFTSCVSKKKYQAATTEAQNAKATNDSLMRRLNELQSQLNDAVSSNKMLTEERDRYERSADSARRGLTAMQGAVDEYIGGMEEVQRKVADRMADYAERGADVQYKGGLVYITLQDELLFRRGTNNISKDGETVLGTLGSVLNEHPNLKVMVVGHTDDRAGRDSWTVSTDRAGKVVRAFRSMKTDPARLTAAGQGEYNPVADNSSAEGRAQNKRTEIVLSPEAFRLLTRDAQ